MKFCHIAPTQYINDVSPYNDCFLTLAHLVESDPFYVSEHKRAYEQAAFEDRSIVKIMDNSGFEFYKEHGPGYVFDPDKLIQLGSRIEAEYIVLPDYPAQDQQVTIDAADKYARIFRQAGFKTFFCPQSYIGDIDGYLNCVQWAIDAKEVDYIGISILGVPNAYAVERNPLQRYNARAWLMKTLWDVGLLDRMRANKKKLHFLGMVDGPNEIILVKEFHEFIDSWDSSAAVWAGINGIRFDRSPTGLHKGKLETSVDFKAEYSPYAMMDVLHNIDYINLHLNEFL